MWARLASGVMALPAAALMGPEAYTAIQADLQGMSCIPLARW